MKTQELPAAISREPGGFGNRATGGSSSWDGNQIPPQKAVSVEADANQATECHSFSALARTVHSDYRRYRATGARNALSVIAFTQGFWATLVFRVSHWGLERVRIWGLRTIVKAGSLVAQQLIEILAGISLPAPANIGPGFYIGHFGGIFIDSKCGLGENCNVSQGVTIGEGGRGELHGVPQIGDRVHIGANAVILGNIKIGDDAVIGPGAVVMSSIPPRGVAMGNPARIVGLTGSFESVKYDNMANDPARQASLAGLSDQPA